MSEWLTCWIMGFEDGWASPWDFSVGYTFGVPSHDEAYDQGVNAGQALRRCTIVLWRLLVS